VKKTFLIAAALTSLMTGGVHAQSDSSILRSLPAAVQKDIEETRTSCRSTDNEINSGDSGLIQFLLGGKRAVLVDNIGLCGDCYHGYNCTNRGTRLVRVYALFENAWSMVLSNDNITGDIFVNLFIGNKECPTRRAGSMSEQSWEARSCVVRWNGTKFTYKPL
jgi:hypothetical protein